MVEKPHLVPPSRVAARMNRDLPKWQRASDVSLPQPPECFGGSQCRRPGRRQAGERFLFFHSLRASVDAAIAGRRSTTRFVAGRLGKRRKPPNINRYWLGGRGSRHRCWRGGRSHIDRYWSGLKSQACRVHCLRRGI